MGAFNYILASQDFCILDLLITFANSLDPDQDDKMLIQSSGSKPFDTLIHVVFLKELTFKKVSTWKITQHAKS